LDQGHLPSSQGPELCWSGTGLAAACAAGSAATVGFFSNSVILVMMTSILVLNFTSSDELVTFMLFRSVVASFSFVFTRSSSSVMEST
jgi:hypothetical protein